jgi:hypothetical protein
VERREDFLQITIILIEKEHIMPKINKDKDKTPIDFNIPTGWDAIQSGRMPTPVNQPNWKYRKPGSSKVHMIDWVVVILFLLFSLAIMGLAFLDSKFSLSVFIVGAMLTIGSVLVLVRGITQARNYKAIQKKRLKDSR